MSTTTSLPFHTKCLFFGLALLYIAFYMHIPVSVLAAYAQHDDSLFFTLGENIAKGEWLGAFSQFTLMKGPGYAFFLAANAFVGIPVTLAHALLHVLATVLMALTTFRLTRAWQAGILCFVFILWHPALLPVRVLRDEIYADQALLLLSCVLSFVYIPHSLRKQVAQAMVAGGVTAWLWLTREEGVWIVPGLGVLCLLTLWQRKKDLVAVRTLVCTISLYLVIAVFFYSLIGMINLSKYGKFVVVDTKDPAYTAAIHALQRVRVGMRIPWVPVPYKVRQEVYKASPTFATLRDYLEGPIGQRWTLPGCAFYPSTCGDFAAGWFLWALRDAAASQNVYTSPHTAAHFFRKIAQEVSHACTQHLLTCEGQTVIPLMPAMSAEQISSLPARLWHAIQLLLGNITPFIGQWPSRGTPEQFAATLKFLGNPRHTGNRDHTTTTLKGWYFSPGPKWFTFACYASDGTPVPTTLLRLPSPDIAQHFHDPEAHTQRFVMQLDTLDDCRIELTTDHTHAFQLSAILAGQQAFIFGQDHFYVDSYANTMTDNQTAKVVNKVDKALLHLYRYAMPPSAFLGVLAYFYVLVISIRQRHLRPDFLIASTLWCLVACRLAILVLVDASSFPAINIKYISAGFPVFCLALLFSVLALRSSPAR